MLDVAHRHARTPVDEALGRPFQDNIVAAVNSFFKQPLVDLHAMQQAGDEAAEQEEHGMDEEEEEGVKEE